LAFHPLWIAGSYFLTALLRQGYEGQAEIGEPPTPTVSTIASAMVEATAGQEGRAIKLGRKEYKQVVFNR